MRSASRPYRQCRWLGCHGRAVSRFAQRMYSMILCSPSPGTSWPVVGAIADVMHAKVAALQGRMGFATPKHLRAGLMILGRPTLAPDMPASARWRSPENTMRGRCHTGSLAILWRMKNRRWSPSRAMKAVPGVMQLESKASSPGGGASPLRAAAAAACSLSIVAFPSSQAWDMPSCFCSLQVPYRVATERRRRLPPLRRELSESGVLAAGSSLHEARPLCHASASSVWPLGTAGGCEAVMAMLTLALAAKAADAMHAHRRSP